MNISFIFIKRFNLFFSLSNNQNIKGIIRTDENKIESIMKTTDNKGCKIIFDCVGASAFENVNNYY